MFTKGLAMLTALMLLLFTVSTALAAVSFDQESGAEADIVCSDTVIEPGMFFVGAEGTGETEAAEQGSQDWGLALGGDLDEEIPDDIKTIFGKDDRVIMKREREKFPYCAVVYLELEFPAGSAFGTGFMIGPNYVLTCGHCVYDKQHGGWAKSIKVIPGRSRDLQPFGSTTSTWLACMDEWYYNEDFSCDLGLIKTRSPIGNKVGWFGYFYPSDSDLQSNARLIGYGQGTTYMYETSGKLLGATRDGLIKYLIDTLPGSSGSPIIVPHNGQDGYAVGVNNCANNMQNMGVRFTQHTVDFFKDYHGK